ncbi:MAG: E3 binding domain-containing protein, partial [Candidatus Saccharimonas sp.]|nr:E3 binding domain-containing protein [Planctomycetaceae bacterium]
MTVEVKVPSFGESVSSVVLVEWLKKVGDAVASGEELVEVESDKATKKCVSPSAGVIMQLLKGEGDSADVGEVIAIIDEKAVAASPSTVPPAAPAAAAPAKPAAAVGHVMPAAARALAENGVAASQVEATGPGGRLLKEDVQRHVAAAAAPVSVVPVAAPTVVSKPAETKPSPVEPPRTVITKSSGERSEKRQAMSPIRKRIASRLVEAQRTGALLTTFNEVDMSAIMSLRKQHQDAFTERYGIKLGFMSFFV